MGKILTYSAMHTGVESAMFEISRKLFQAREWMRQRARNRQVPYLARVKRRVFHHQFCSDQSAKAKLGFQLRFLNWLIFFAFYVFRCRYMSK